MHSRSSQVLAALSLISAMSLSAATIIVDAGGGGNYTTIQAAIDAAANGDAIEVWPGTYTENVQFPTSTPVKDLVLRSRDGPAVTTIDGGGDPLTPSTGIKRGVTVTGGQTSATVIEGFSITKGVANGHHGGGVYIVSASPIIRGNLIVLNYATGGGGGIYAEGFYGVIEGNRIYENRAHFGAGIRISTSTGGGTPIVQNNLIYDNIVHAGITSTAEGQGIRINSAPVLLANNVVYGNIRNESSHAVNGGGIFLANSSGVVIRNCIVRNNGTSNLYYPVYGQWFCNNVEYASPGSLSGAGNFDADPLFVDAAAGDFQINAFSSCIDAGDSTDAPALDFAGNVRVDCPTVVDTGLSTVTFYDVGAYEFVSGNTAPTAVADTATTDEDTAVEVMVLANDTDVDNDTFTIESVTTPLGGSAAISGDSTFIVYTPNSDFNGTDAFSYTVSDGNGGTATADVSMTIVPVNDVPVADGQATSTSEDTPFQILLTASDIDGDALSFDFTQPSHGTLTGSAPDLTYTPAANYHGADSFTFTASDGEARSTEALVSITLTPVNDAPHAIDQAVTTAEDTATPITLAAADVDGDVITCAIVAQPAHGSMTGTAPNLVYIPTPDYHGPDAFTFRANDGLTASADATVSLTITPENDVPFAKEQTVTTAEDTVALVTLTASDVDADALTYEIVDLPDHGALSGDPPNVTYTPATDYSGADSLSFLARDGMVTSNVATVTLVVTPVNDVPVAHDQGATIAEDTVVSITLTASDADGDALAYEVVAQPARGTLTGTAPDFVYTPVADCHGTDSFTFTVSDRQVTSAAATVWITITPVNDAPAANGQIVTTAEDTAIPIPLAASDVDGDALTYEIVAPPAHGALTGSAPNIVYTPVDNYNGPDLLTFRANDGGATSANATVSVTVTPVNDAAVAYDQSLTTPEDTPVAVTLTATDVDDDALTYAVVGPPTHGTLTGTAPNLVYTPAADYHGSDTFTFRAADGLAESNPAYVRITINSVNDTPIAQDQSVTIAEDTELAIRLTASDENGDTLTYVIVAQPAHGALAGTPPDVLYTPAGDYYGPDGFTFMASDGSATSAVATVSVTVTSVNDAPAAQDQSVTMAEDTALAITLSATDADADTLLYTVVTQPAHGTFSGVAPDLVYTPAADYHGPDSFTFTASDGSAVSNVAAVSITLVAVNDAPVADDQSVITAEDTPIAITLTAHDADGDALSYEILDAPVHGSLSADAPTLVYAPAADFHGEDTFTLRANDGTATSNVAMVSITVTPVNDVPVAADDAFAVYAGTTLQIATPGVLANDTDAEQDLLEAVLVSSAANGALNLNADGSFTYLPNAGFVGLDAFTYEATDGTTQSDAATVTIDVQRALTTFRRGDANSDSHLDIGDAISIVNYLFARGRTPTCLASADANDDAAIDIGDAVKLLEYLFSAGTPPAAPFEICGTDPRAAGDNCLSYEPCE